MPARSLAAALVLAALACASPTRKWIEDGVERGTVRVVATADGQRHEYRDRSQRLVRVERRTEHGDLVPGAPIEHREYDGTALTVLRYTDAEGRPATGPEGFALRRTRTETTPAGETAVHHEHFDEADRPLVLSPGQYRETLTFDGNRLLHRRFYDLAGERVAIELGEHRDVSEIRYAHLKGATPIVMEMVVDSEGTPLEKRRISGFTERRIDWVWINPGYVSTAYPSSGRYVTYSSGE